MGYERSTRALVRAATTFFARGSGSSTVSVRDARRDTPS